MFIATADPMPLYAIDEIGDLLTEIHLRSDRGVDCLLRSAVDDDRGALFQKRHANGAS